MNLPEKFQLFWKQHPAHLSVHNCDLLLAVSGGVDSVVMTDLFFNAGFNFSIAHCNFQLRAEESERDEAFVRSLTEKYNKEVLVKRFDTKQYAEEKKISIQEAARELRYNWFAKLQTSNLKLQTSNLKLQTSNFKPQTSNLLATAHHADDNIETMLMFFFRGTGIHGLTGIPVYDKERKIIRPLLGITKEEILDYAKENNLSWVEDSSNDLDQYTRNFFRNELIPAIKAHFPQVKDNLLQNLQRFEQVEQLYQQSIELNKKNLLEYKGNEIHIPVLKLQKTEALNTVLWEIIRVYNFHSHQVDEVKKLFGASNSSYVQSSSHRIIKNRNWLIIAPNAREEAEHILIEENDKQIQFRNGILNIETIPTSNLKPQTSNLKPGPTASSVRDQTSNFKPQTSNITAELDAKHIEFPLLLRKWKQGDYFYPLGMQNLPAGRHGKKKLSRFFIDQKLSKTEKETIWVIEMNKKILWVVGYRIDDRFKLTASTTGIFKITFTPLNQPKHV